MPAIKIQKLTKYYLGHKVIGVRNLDLEVKAGEVFGFIGPNGAGKTTTIRLLLDLIRPSSGKAEIFGSDINKDSLEIRQNIGYLPGEIFLADNISGSETIEYFASFKGNIDLKYIDDLCRRFEFDSSKKVGTYSKGNKQKLAIILALMHKPKLLILDEPTSGLDPLNQQEFYKIILELKDAGTTVFFSTHILEEAEKLCDRVGIIRAGKLLRIENVDDFRAKNIREIHFETDEDLTMTQLQIPGVIEAKKMPGGYHLITTGPNAVIIKHLSGFKFTDIKVLEPSLEETFFDYYHKDKEQ